MQACDESFLMGNWFVSQAEIDANVKIGKRLERRRKILGMSQRVLGEKIGLSDFKPIYKYETGEVRIPAVRLYTLSIALECPISYFFEDLPNGLTL